MLSGPAAAQERQMQLTCSSHRPPGATADNRARCGRGKSPQSLSFRSFQKCRPASRAPGQTCCTADTASSPPANVPLRRAGRPSRSSSSRCEIHLRPRVLALRAGVALFAARAGRWDTSAGTSEILLPPRVLRCDRGPAFPSACNASSPLASARTALPAGKGRTR